MIARGPGGCRPRRRFGLTATLLAAALTITPLATGSAGAINQGATLKYYKTVVAKFNALPAVREAISGDFFFGYSSSTKWFLTFLKPAKEYSYQQPAVDTVVIAMAKGKIVWETDTFSAACAGKKSCHPFTPMRFYTAKGGAYWAELSGAHQSATCWYQATGPTVWIKTDFDYTGKPAWYAGNDPFVYDATFVAMKSNQSTVTVTSTYKFKSDHQVATEVDTIAAKTKLFTKSTLKAAKGTRADEPAFSDSESITTLKPAPKAPQINTCP